MTDFLDSATVKVAITPSGVDRGPYTDSATVYFDIVVSSVEEHNRPDFTGEGLAHNRFETWEGFQRFEADANARFTGVMRQNA